MADSPLAALDPDAQQALAELGDALSSLDSDERAAVAELAQARADGQVSRRQLLKAAGAIGAGAVVGGGSAAALTGDADAADTGTAVVGAPGNPADVHLDRVLDDGGDLVADLDDSGDLVFQNRGLSGLSSIDTGNVSIDDGGDWNGATIVRSASEYQNARTSGNSIIIPSGETVEISSNAELVVTSDDISIWIQQGATLKLADGADNTAVIYGRANNLKIRNDGTIDANRQNQAIGQRAGVVFASFTESSPHENCILYGTGEVTNCRQRALVFNQEVIDCEFRGITVTNFKADSNGHQVGDFGSGGTSDERRPVGCGFRNVTIKGGTFDTSSADADGIKGTGAVSPDDESPNYVHDCQLFQLPRRGIFGPDKITDNIIVAPASGSGGGDAITGGDQVCDNHLVGTFDSSGDNAIIIQDSTTVANNHIEGFTNNAIRFDASFSTDVSMVSVTGNKCVDNNQSGDATNGNIALLGTDSNGGFIVKENICRGVGIDPINNIIVESGCDNGRVTENVTQGATTEIDDSSPSSVTVADNVTI